MLTDSFDLPDSFEIASQNVVFKFFSAKSTV